jgi:hypothetical protein
MPYVKDWDNNGVIDDKDKNHCRKGQLTGQEVSATSVAYKNWDLSATVYTKQIYMLNHVYEAI